MYVLTVHLPNPSPLAGEGGPKGRMRGLSELSASERRISFRCGWDSAPPHPSAFGCHLLPRGEKGRQNSLLRGASTARSIAAKTNAGPLSICSFVNRNTRKPCPR